MSSLIVAEDCVYFRRQITQALQNDNFQVKAWAGDGQSALAAYTKFLPDFVVMDVILPVMGGIEVCRKIRLLNPKARIVLYSGVKSEIMMRNSYAVGAMDFLQKPFSPEQLSESLQNIVQHAYMMDMIKSQKKTVQQ